MDVRNHIQGQNKEELQYVLLHTSALDPVGYTAAKAQFYYNTTNNTPKFRNASAWEYFAHVKTAITTGAIIVGDLAEIKELVSTQNSFVRSSALSVGYLQQYIAFADLNPTAICTTIVAPGDNITLTTEKAVVDYVTGITATLQVNSDWNAVGTVAEILNKPSLDFDKYEYWQLQGNRTIINYGALYNWYAATDARKISSSNDWIIPSKANYDTLSAYLGGDLVSGGKLKETGTTYWKTPNIGADNISKFNARGTGLRGNAGTFLLITEKCNVWASNSFSPGGVLNGYISILGYDIATISTNNVQPATYGSPVRLLKTSTTLTDGETGTYTGNDGKVYRTICIGTQEWLADNLNETKFRNGDSITLVTDNSAWAALTTEGYCYYNNLESNGYDTTSDIIEITSKDKVSFKSGTPNVDITVEQLSATEAQITFYVNTLIPSTVVTTATKGLWDVTNTSGALSVPAYAASGVGHFDSSATAPTDITTTLNYNGIFRSTRLYEGNTRVMTVHGVQAASGTMHTVTNSSHAGFCPQLPVVAGTSQFLRGDGTWASTSAFNFWQRNGTVLSPLTAGDSIEIARSKYIYHSQVIGVDTAGDWRTYSDASGFYTDYCTVGNATKGAGTWVMKNTINI